MQTSGYEYGLESEERDTAMEEEDEEERLIGEENDGEDPSNDDAVQQYLREIGGYPLLTKSEEVELAKRVQVGNAEQALATRNRPHRAARIVEGREAQQALITANLRLVVSIAKRYASQGIPLLDLIQEGNLGLMVASERFDWRKGNRFSTYATWWIRQTITRAIANKGRDIRLPAYQVAITNRIHRTRRLLFQELQREPTSKEIGELLGISEEKIRETLFLGALPISLQSPVGEFDDAELVDFLQDDSVTPPEEEATTHFLRSEIEAILERLPERQRKIVELRFGLKDDNSLTLEEIGRQFDITRERVRQLLNDALKSIRKMKTSAPLRQYLD